MPGQGRNGRVARRGGLWTTAIVALAAALAPGAAPARAQTASGSVWLYSARPGDTIWDLSRRYLADWHRWPELQAFNRVEDPRRIPPGSILRFPTGWLRPEPATAQALAVEPPAEVRLGPRQPPEPLTPNRALPEGAVVSTGLHGSATLALRDGTQLLVPGGTRLVLERLRGFWGTPLADSELRLEVGRLAPSGVARGSRLSIQAPPGTTSVRGTGFRVALPEGPARLTAETLEGAVAVAAGGRRVRVPAGFGTSARAGDPPRPPVPLLPPPDTSRVAPRAERVPFPIELVPLVGAVRYRLVVGSDPSFATLLADEIQDGPMLRGPSLPDGRYPIRVRGIDGRGLEGRDASRWIEIDARPEPPAPLLPRRAARVREPAPRFAWAEPVDAAGYRFRLAPAGAPDRPLIDRADLAAAELVPPDPLPVGDYVWQVATRARDGEIGPLSDPQPFARLEPLPVPEPEVAAATSDETVLRLPTAVPRVRHRVQLARDSAFADIALERVLEEPELRVRHLYPDRYYLRARTIEPDGYEGAFSAPQRLDVVPARWWPLGAIPLALLLLAVL